MSQEDYLLVNGKKLRRGITTGSCAAAAAKAAVNRLFTGEVSQQVTISLPSGETLVVPIAESEGAPSAARCAVVKDGGDDPDVTTGLSIWAEAKASHAPGVHLETGEGIGMVTLPGLKVPVGQPAINPVPRAMILAETKKVLPENTGVTVTLFVPGGEAVAAQTFNPRLGIVGGISIIGTSGRVNPMSEEAWKEALALELKVLTGKGYRQAVYVFGNYGEDFLKNEFGEAPENLLKISNYLGFMLDQAVNLGIDQVLLAGHLGKLVKVSAGIFHTHSRVADARLEILAAHAAMEGASQAVVTQIMASTTTDGAVSILREHHLTGVYQRIVINAARRCEAHTHGRVGVGCILFHGNGELAAMDDRAKNWMEEMRRNSHG